MCGSLYRFFIVHATLVGFFKGPFQERVGHWRAEGYPTLLGQLL